MSYRSTAILLAVLVVLGGIVYSVMRQPAPDQSGAASQSTPVVTFSPQDATKIVVSSADKTTEIARTSGTWAIVRPEATPADAARVEGWIDQLGNLTAERVVDDVTDLGTYGLNQPRLNVEVDLAGGKTIRLAFGDKTPDGGAYYVRLPDDASKAKSVYLISAPLGDDLNSALTKPPKAIPTPTPLPTLVPATPAPTTSATASPAPSPTPQG